MDSEDGGVESFVPTPSPSSDYFDNDARNDGEWTVQEQVYATVGFILRFFLPIVFIMLCCRIKMRRGERSLLDGGTFNNEEGGAIGERTRQEREKFVSETLCTKKVIAADDKTTVPSFEEDALEKGDIIVPKPNAEGDDEETASPNEFDAPSCSICFSEYEPGETICWSRNPDCSHAYHSECMTKWLLKHDDCPHCRQEYLKVVDEAQAGEAAEGGAVGAGSSGLQISAGDGPSASEAADGNGRFSAVGDASADADMVDIDLEAGAEEAASVAHSAEILRPIPVPSSGR